jgi:Domain of unknown function (DUF4399)
MKSRYLLTLLIVAGAALAADLPRTPAPPDARVYIILPQDGATVTSPVTLRFGLSGMGIAPAGIAMAGTGHHHLLIDAELPPFDQPIPADEHHLHFGKGQTEALVKLAPGPHRLQLLLADHLHLPHEPPVVSEPISITVK